MSDPTSRTSTAASTALAALANPRRRQVLNTLAAIEHDRMCLEELVEAIADDDTDRLAIALHHHHLPQLHAAGIVDYQPERNEVVYIGDETVDELLATIDRHAPAAAADD